MYMRVIRGLRGVVWLWAGAILVSPKVSCGAVGSGAEPALREGYDAAGRLRARGSLNEATEAYRLLSERAIRESDDYWAYYATRNLAHAFQLLGRTRDSETSARVALHHICQLLNQGDSRIPRHDALAEKAVAIGYIEKSLSERGRIAAGLAMHRQVVDAIGDMMCAMGDPGGRDLAGELLERVDDGYRYLLLRAVWREAAYLDIQGDTAAAVALVRRADHRARGMGLTDGRDLNYWFKIRGAMATMVGFLGYRREQMELLSSIIEDAGAVGQPRPCCIARVNLARARSQYYGPRLEFLEEALSASRDLGRSSPGQEDHDGERVIAKMIHDLRGERAAVDQLDAVLGKFQELGRDFDAQYAERDRLVMLRERGEYAGLERGFIRLLEESRARGIKRAEPTLYREYAYLLAGLGRHREAALMLRRAIAMSRAFGWHLHLPDLLIKLADCHYLMGDMAGMEAAWEEIDRLMAEIPDMPPERVLDVMVGRMTLLRRKGDEAGVRALFARATEFTRANGIPDFLARGLHEFPVDGPATANPVASNGRPAADLQPVEMVTHVLEGESARGRFTVSNPGDREISGRVVVRGPDAALSTLPEERALRVVLSGGSDGVREVTRDISLGAGEQVVVYLDVKAAGTDELMAAVTWQPSDGGVVQSGEWSCKGDGSGAQVAVVNASLSRDNPFYSVPLYHEVYRRGGGDGIEDFRIRVSSPAYVEVADEVSGRVLAVDRGGDGAFDGPGDLVIDDVNGNGFPDLRFDKVADVAAVELRISCMGMEPGAYGEEGISVFFEVREKSGWVLLAEDRLLAPAARD